VIYYRFHGPGKLYASDYSDYRLKKYAEKFTRWAEEGHVIYAFFNNDNGGYAPWNAMRLMQFVK